MNKYFLPLIVLCMMGWSANIVVAQKPPKVTVEVDENCDTLFYLQSFRLGDSDGRRFVRRLTGINARVQPFGLQFRPGRVQSDTASVCDGCTLPWTVRTIELWAKKQKAPEFAFKGWKKPDVLYLPPTEYKYVVETKPQLSFTMTEPVKEQKARFPLYAFLEYGVLFGTSNHSPFDNAAIRYVRGGIQTNPYGRPFDLELSSAFFPKKDFQWPYALQTVDDPAPPNNLAYNEDCNCTVEKPLVSLGLKASFRAPIGRLFNGEWGIMPHAAVDQRISEVPADVSGRPVVYTIPASVVVGVDTYWQRRHYTKTSKHGRAVTGLVYQVRGPGLLWQFRKDADRNLMIRMLSVRLVYGAKPAKK